MINVYQTAAMQKHLDPEWYNPRFSKHGMHCAHLLVSGPSGSGKTVYVANYLSVMERVFHDVIIATTLVNEPIYAMLQERLKDRCTVCPINQLPKVESLDQTPRLVVIDDFLGCNQKEMSTLVNFATIARKKQTVCMFLTQSFFATPKPIRLNMRYLVLLAATDKRNLNSIAGTIASELQPKVLKSIIADATKEQFSVFIADTRERDLNKRYRRNWGDRYTFAEDEDGEWQPTRLYAT